MLPFVAVITTPDEYLRIERAAEWKSDYLDGEMFPRVYARMVFGEHEQA